MLRHQDSPNRITNRNGASANGAAAHSGYSPADRGNDGLDIQRELERLEEMLLDSPRFLSRTIVNEERLIEQLDVIRISLPSAFQEAQELLQQKEDILLEAEQVAQEIIEAAERRAAQILDEMGLIRQAEIEMQQIRQRVQLECEEAQDQVMEEIERMRRQAQQDIEEMRRRAIAEAEDIQAGADDYADRLLGDLEQQFNELLRVVRNGRQQLQVEPPTTPPKPATSPTQVGRSPHPGRTR